MYGDIGSRPRPRRSYNPTPPQSGDILNYLLGKSDSKPGLAFGFPANAPEPDGLISQTLNTMSGAGQDLASQLQRILGERSQQADQPSALEQLAQAMSGELNAGSGLNTADYEQALQNSAAQIKQAFGAQIGAVRASSGAARRQTKRSKRQIRKMYNALNKAYMRDAGAEVAQGKAISNELGQIAGDAQANVQKNANESVDQLAALSQSLGVESAAPNQIAAQQTNTGNAISKLQQIAQNDQSLQMQNSGAQQRYLVRGGKGALLEGTNRRADLVQQLQAFLQDNAAKIADIKGQRGQALAANQNDFASKMAQAQGDAGKETWNRQMDLAHLLLSIQGANQKQNPNDPSGNSDLPDWMKQQNSVIGGDSAVGGLIQQLFQSNPNILAQQGRINGTDFRMNAFEAGNLAYQEAIKQGLSQDQALKAYYAAMMQQKAFG